ncbi:MAG: hypothetical protein RR322_06220 [Oscillospiraceae bacterium]
MNSSEKDNLTENQSIAEEQVIEAPQVKFKTKKAISLEAFVFLGIFCGLCCLAGSKMGALNFLNTMMNTSVDLLVNTVFYITAVAVLTGALSGVFSEFGVVALINQGLTPLMRPVYGLPGASAIGVLTCYLSDNPAILTLAEDKGFKRYFKKYQLPALTNIGTSFGMGLIITTFMVGVPSPSGENFLLAVLIGNVAAIIGSIVSTRIMLRFTSKIYGKEVACDIDEDGTHHELRLNERIVRNGSVGSRLLEAVLQGGTTGVSLGVAVIPGVLIICSIVLLLTNGPSAAGTYTGAAGEGVALLPAIGEKLNFILKPLFGFSDPRAIAVPITALGAAGAAIGLVPSMVASGTVHANDIAVFTAMCMCWSGYLSTHVAMMSSLKCSELTGKAIISHTIGGFCAGIAANWIFKLVTMFI